MPFSLTFDRRHRVLLARFSGELTQADLLAMQDTARRFAAREGPCHGLVDLTAVETVSVPSQSLIDNAHALVDSVVKAKPAAARGKYLKSVTVSSTMGPGVVIDTAHIDERVKH